MRTAARTVQGWESACEGYAKNGEEFVLTQTTELDRTFCDDFCAKHKYKVKPSENPSGILFTPKTPN